MLSGNGKLYATQIHADEPEQGSAQRRPVRTAQSLSEIIPSPHIISSPCVAVSGGYLILSLRKCHYLSQNLFFILTCFCMSRALGVEKYARRRHPRLLDRLEFTPSDGVNFVRNLDPNNKGL